eukprot:5555134-Prymnesium_polylepis.1
MRRHDLYKTVLCKRYTLPSGCPHEEDCWFAHGERELRNVQADPASSNVTRRNAQPESASSSASRLWKTTLCRHYSQTGSCQHGGQCAFAHGEQELRQAQASASSSTTLEKFITEKAVQALHNAGGSMRLATFFVQLYACCPMSRDHIKQNGGPKIWASNTFKTDYSLGPGNETIRAPTMAEYVEDLTAELTRLGGQCQLSQLDHSAVPTPLGTRANAVLEAHPA